jgi:hypothetical protein
MMEKTEKLHILVVLEKGSPVTINSIRTDLEKDFSLKPNLVALRKNLQRCRQQGLVSAEKIGRSNFYMATEKGKKRRRIVAAKRDRGFKDWLSKKYPTEKPNVHVSDQKTDRYALAKRAMEIKLSLRFCEALLSDNHNPDTLNLARTAKMYWQNEESELMPYITEDLFNLVAKTSRQVGKLFDSILK